MAWWFYLALAVVGVVWIGWRDGAPRLGLFVDPGGWWIDLGLGVATGLGLVGLWEVTRRWLPRARELEGLIAKALGGLTTSEAAALALLSGFSEELFFRGAVQGAFDYLPWLWTAGLFAILHTGSGRAFRLWTLFAFVAGVALGLLIHYRGNLLAPVVAHVTVNWINLVRMVRGKTLGQ
jgi:uncharacterized protein